MVQKTYAIPAMGAGHFEMMGSIVASGAMRLDVPEGVLNIGGNGKGYVLPPLVDWDPTAVANQDGSLDSLTLGDDVYLYAVQGADGRAGLVASTNITVPGGYTSETSRKIGGFHYGRVRTIAQRYDTAITPATQIVPNSVWDLSHRPTCDPTGMVEVVPGRLWVDIYLNSEGSGTWPENIPVSRFGVQPIKDDIYSRSDFHLLVRNAGKRLPTVEEFLTYAEGAPQGNDGNNDLAWSATGNSGPTTTGAVAKAVSMFNVVDAAGNLWDWLDNHHDLGGTYNWTTSVVNVGKDSSIPRGQVYHAAWRCFVGGGNFGNGVRCGARCLYSHAHPWSASGSNGFRGACDAL
ncbi:hypothetical protein [Halomonas saccharevitans]|uniref:Major tropism determinant second domain-containing protein n=1 Tax=Halomonas saccharevitans TaxID=416872 RepID=A0A1I7AFB2_9GAMM|nr:hypothetical protein [Halomonas saccharevitans]SFT73629.1 hypothetical protein SAMN04487956_11736 [Halomonas saccharevitans]